LWEKGQKGPKNKKSYLGFTEKPKFSEGEGEEKRKKKKNPSVSQMIL